METIINREIGKLGDIVIINGNKFELRNSYNLIVNEELNERYYEVKLHGCDEKIIIDEDKLEQILILNLDGVIYNNKWYYSNNTVITYCSNNNRPQLGKYLLNYLNQSVLKVHHKNGNKLDFRMVNLELITQSENNKLAKRIRKPIAAPIPSKFFDDKEKIIIEYFNQDTNSYKLLKVNETNYEYYEMNVSEEITFIFDKEQLEKVLKINWYLRAGYVSSKIPSSCNDPEIIKHFNHGNTIYLHTYLMKLNGFEIPDGSSIDHINFNKFDNRLCNLRVATQSEQNSNRPNVERSVIIPEPLKGNLDLDHNEIPMYIHLLKPKDGHAIRFEVEFKAFDIQGVKHNLQSKTTSKNSLNIIEKLCNGIAIRYNLILEKNIDITRLTIDGLKFNTHEEFLEHSNSLIYKFMKRLNKEDIDTVEKFNKYLKLQLFNRTSITKPKTVLPNNTTIEKNDILEEDIDTKKNDDDDVVVAIITKSKKTRIPKTQIIPKPIIDETKYTITLKDETETIINFETLKPAYINYVKPKDKRSSTFDGEINVCVKPRKKFVISGLTNEKLDLNERLAWSLVKRYSIFVVQENRIYNDSKTTDTNPPTTTITNEKRITDFTFNENPLFTHNNKLNYKFETIKEFRTHTELYISSILNKKTTLEDLINYVEPKTPKLQKPIIDLQF